MIVDLRDYSLAPGTRDNLVERFEALFMDAQERLGATMLGAFRDADLPDRFVFVRACPDLPTRQRVLTEYYERGEQWQENKAEVNSWIVDSDNVLLMRPIAELAPPATGVSVVGMFQRLEHRPLTPGEAELATRDVPRAIQAHGGRLIATFATDPAENNYPRHPIRAGEHGLIWFATFPQLPMIALPTVVQRRLLPISRSRMR